MIKFLSDINVVFISSLLRFARFYARFYWVVTLVSGSVGIGCILVSALAIPLPNFDDPTKVGFFLLRNYFTLSVYHNKALGEILVVYSSNTMYF